MKDLLAIGVRDRRDGAPVEVGQGRLRRFDAAYI
jgi:hypothetical protein